MLQAFEMAEANPVSTPADTSVNLLKDDSESKPVDSSMYQSRAGSLLRAAIGTRPDIAEAVSTMSKFNKEPNQAHLTAVKRVLGYLNGTALGIVYGSTSEPRLAGFADATAYPGDQDDRRSTTGNMLLLSEAPVSWFSQRQKTVAMSTTEAEHMALSSATQEAIWLRRLLADLKSPETGPTVVYENNQGAIALAKSPVAHKRTINTLTFGISLSGTNSRKVYWTFSNTDFLTKGSLPQSAIESLRKSLGMRWLPYIIRKWTSSWLLGMWSKWECCSRAFKGSKSCVSCSRAFLGSRNCPIRIQTYGPLSDWLVNASCDWPALNSRFLYK